MKTESNCLWLNGKYKLTLNNTSRQETRKLESEKIVWQEFGWLPVFSSHHMPYIQVGCTTRGQCYNLQCYNVQSCVQAVACTDQRTCKQLGKVEACKASRPSFLPSEHQNNTTLGYHCAKTLNPKNSPQLTPHESKRLKDSRYRESIRVAKCTWDDLSKDSKGAKEQRILKWAIFLIKIKLFHIEAYMSVETCSRICPHPL